MITFTHGNRSFSLEPSDFFNPSLYKTDQDPISGNDKKNIKDIRSNNNMNEIKLLNIDGRLHSFVERPTTKSHHSIPLYKGIYVSVVENINNVKQQWIMSKRLIITTEPAIKFNF